MLYLDAGHGAGHVEVRAVPAPGLHEGHAVAKAHVLCRILPRGDVDGGDDVGRMRVEPACSHTK